MPLFFPDPKKQQHYRISYTGYIVNFNMIRLEQTIEVSAPQQIVWGFLSDLSKSLIYNRFHTEIELPGSYLLKAGSEFTIYHNFGLSTVRMTARVLKWLPLHGFTIEEFNEQQPESGFRHSCSFEITGHGNITMMVYTIEGSLNNRLKEASLRPLLKGVMKSELQKIKQAIESSVPLDSPFEIQGVPS
ncbi:MAG: SRPBCC family protein [FCB group bacterium]|nr:SRPBCC family protein [FCB group bacterium]